MTRQTKAQPSQAARRSRVQVRKQQARNAAAGTPADGGDAPLAEGWLAAKDGEGLPYYYHEITGRARWSRPTAAALQEEALAALPVGGTTGWSTTQQARYYVDPSGVSHWTLPVDAKS